MTEQDKKALQILEFSNKILGDTNKVLRRENKELKEQLALYGVVASLPSRLEMNNQSEKEFEEMKLITNKVMYKHFRLGFSTCYEWMLYVLNNKG